MHRGTLLDWVALGLLPGFGPILTRRALERFGDPGEIAHRVPVSALAELGLPGKQLAALRRARRDLRRQAEAELERAARLRVRVAVPGAPDYPAALLELPDPPVTLFYAGELLPAIVRAGIVGSRRATSYGRRVAAGLAAGLAARGIEVVSGGARGVDTAAHVGALEEKGGRTVAILGSGLARPYPTENRRLFERMRERGAVVSELPLDTPPQPENFPRRNRLISGLAAALVVVEAGARSGSLITARHALEQGREVLAVPGQVSSEQSEGCHRLIQQGAKLIQRIDDILEELSPMYRTRIGPAPEDAPAAAVEATLDGLLPDEIAVGGMLDPTEPVRLDDLAERAPFGIARLQAALLGLELAGRIERLPGPCYLRLESRRLT